MRPLANKTTVRLLMAFELPESTLQDDRLTFRASTMELWNALNSLASFDIVSIDQQHRRVASSLTRIAYVVNKLMLVSPTYPWKPASALSYGLITKALCRNGSHLQPSGHVDILRPSFLRHTPFGSGHPERFKSYSNDEHEQWTGYDDICPSRCYPNALRPSSLGAPSQKLGQGKAKGDGRE